MPAVGVCQQKGPNSPCYARPNIPKEALQKLNELSYEVLPHKSYSPDFLPTDYQFFKHLDNFFAGKMLLQSWKAGCRKCFPISDMISAFLLCSSNQTLIYQAEICGKGLGGCSFLFSWWLGEEVLKENPKPSLTSTDNEDIDLSKLPPLNLMFPAPLRTVIVDLFSI